MPLLPTFHYRLAIPKESFIPIDKEKHLPHIDSSPFPLLSVNPSSPAFHCGKSVLLGMYLGLNLGLTLFNKAILMHMPFPTILTAMHALSGFLGSFALVGAGYFVPVRLNKNDSIVVFLFSFLYAINIIISNYSMQLVTIPFHQVVRASAPIFIILFTTLLFGVRVNLRKLVSLLPVMVGVGLATYGDYCFTPTGFFFTLGGTLLAALKTVLTNSLQSSRAESSRGDIPTLPTTVRSKDSLVNRPVQSIFQALVESTLRYRRPQLQIGLHPLDLLIRMSPLSFLQCLAFAYFSGEMTRIKEHIALCQSGLHGTPLRWQALALLCNGLLAFALNIVSFTANRQVGPLSMTVAANVKQVTTIVVAVLLFDVHISGTNAAGIFLTLVGGGYYAKIDYEERRPGRRIAMG